MSVRTTSAAKDASLLRWWSQAIAVTMAWAMAPIAAAFEPYENVQVHGFLTQGYFLTSGNNLFGESTRGGSLDFTEIGVNASWTPLPNLQFATQLLSRRAGEGHSGDDFELDFGLVDYTLRSTATQRLGLRLGRVRLPVALYNDTRDVAFARPSILLPQSIYPDVTRDLSLSGDGGLVYGELRSAYGDWFLEIGGILPRVNNRDTDFAVFGVDAPGELDPRLSLVGRLLYEYDGGRVRLGVSGAQINSKYNPRFSPADDLLAGTDRFDPLVFSFQYNAENWSLTSEYALRFSEDKGFGLFPDASSVGESYYGQFIYRIDPSWEALVRYDVTILDQDDPEGIKAKRVDRPAHLSFANDWTFGLRYNITPSLMMRAEYHRVHGTGWVNFQDNPDQNELEKNWDIFAVLFSYRF
jgi:hypothetical protein